MPEIKKIYMKAKYKLDQRDKNSQKLSDIKSLDSLTNREQGLPNYQEEAEVESCRENLKKSKFHENNFQQEPEELSYKQEMEHEGGYEYKDEYENYNEEKETFNRNDNENYENYNYTNNDQSQDYEKFPEQEEPQYENENHDEEIIENEKNENYPNYPDNKETKVPSKNITSYTPSRIESIKDLQSSRRSNYNNSELNNFKRNVNESKINSKDASIVNRDQFSQGSHNVSNYELFDKAKENLLKIKSELDEMDQFDYRNRTPGNVSIVKQQSNNQSRLVEDRNRQLQREFDVDEYLVEEEQPKNLEEEISMSMSIAHSLREDSQIINQSQYRFNAPYVSGLSANLSPIQASHKENRERNIEIKRQMNNYMPTPVSSHRNNTGRTLDKSGVQGSRVQGHGQGQEQRQVNVPNNHNNQSHLKRTPSYSMTGSATATLEKDRGRSQSKTKFNNVHNPYNRDQSSSGEKERENDRKNSPYFKK
jgi:hypothetical protein